MFSSFRALLPDLTEDLVRKALDPIYPNQDDKWPHNSCQSESKTESESSKGFFYHTLDN